MTATHGAQAPRQASIRFSVDPGDVPPEKAARRLHLTAAEFDAALPRLLARGFPAPDPTTGMFDLEAIDRWRKARNRKLFPEIGDVPPESRTSKPSIGERFREAQRASEGRRRQG